ncbi:MAG TPA: FAD-dependent oxidoreductase [Ktedonobacteraceae bacterium]|nr:FAD-dependent oxidoreductase [Ktedonobacteraceae bacterium]
MVSKSYDLIVIGAGAAGSGAAMAATKKDRKILQIERDNIGGTCLNYGCDPTKTLLEIAKLIHQSRHAKRFGLHIPTVNVDWSGVQKRVQEVITQMRGGTFEEASQQLAQSGIEVLRGEAHFTSSHTIEVGQKQFNAEKFVIASGCEAFVPPIEGLQEAGYLTNKEATRLSALPGSLAIIGAGAIGIEFAQLFQRFGVKVTVIEGNPMILAKEDHDLAVQLCDLLEEEGIQLKPHTRLKKVQQRRDGKHLTLSNEQEGESTLVVDEILVAIGRQPALEALQPEKAGIEIQKQGIVVDKYLQTSQPHIWAAGDVASSYQFTHIASEQGRIAGYNAFAETPRCFEPRAIPWVTYTDPPLSHLGQTEDELREAGSTYRSFSITFDQVERAIIEGRTEGRLKLLLDGNDKLLGAHILGKNADDLLSQLILAMQSDLTIKQIAAAIMPYPTLSEAIRAAAQEAI